MTTAPTRTFTAPVGRIVGHRDGAVVRALGIPYARSERFARPEPVPPFAEDFIADTPAPVPPQPSTPVLEALIHPIEAEVSEQCQALSVTVPADVRDDERLPVMVWIHGGSYVVGGGDIPIHDPRALVEEQRVVVVAVTYRLGVLGFLGDGERVPANLGLLDIVQALRWVRGNIAAFGGDPESVTLFGQSAGGDAIAHLMAADGTAGLFRRVIVQSAPLGLSRRRARMNRAMVRAVRAVGPETGLDEVLSLQAAAERVALPYGLRGGMPFGTQYGHAPLPAERHLDAAWRRAAPHVEVLIGSASDEAALYLPMIPGLAALCRTRTGRALVRWLLVRPLTAVIYGRDARAFAARHRAAGGRAVVYRLHRGVTVRPTGAVHMSDVPLLLGDRQAWAGSRFVPERDWAAVERRGPGIRAVWAEFARTGRVTIADDETLTFDRG
ncbi:carboxylesterase family protein [Curtobacterium sp. MCBD17_032]|uniref:carboxylesterase family protein n=1 Tax=Curtobacterium sp. MCBD17_032 TaxID=2175659 RepID=UPI000DA83BD6|nr:carboxylesterase family protein [Curtobacterium sp. MCBD17_032]PZE87000.1 carboxylesterase/lipase family protein [Curtobacterium sp. MCBD17_032]